MSVHYRVEAEEILALPNGRSCCSTALHSCEIWSKFNQRMKPTPNTSSVSCCPVSKQEYTHIHINQVQLLLCYVATGRNVFYGTKQFGSCSQLMVLEGI